MNRSFLVRIALVGVMVLGLLVACAATEEQPACAATAAGPGPGGPGPGSSSNSGGNRSTSGGGGSTGGGGGKPALVTSVQKPANNAPPKTTYQSNQQVAPPKTIIQRDTTGQRSTAREPRRVYPPQPTPAYRGDLRYYAGWPGYYVVGTWPIGYAEHYGCTVTGIESAPFTPDFP
ncbi:hypothetical protein [Streptosporangium sp. NPDC002524]|uniref:hypothetical protein n=1 Tax=Streptosporangium sp. NPDC002524 TaxID=3154537 RepID=UPI0033251673